MPDEFTGTANLGDLLKISMSSSAASPSW